MNQSSAKIKLKVNEDFYKTKSKLIEHGQSINIGSLEKFRALKHLLIRFKNLRASLRIFFHNY